MRAKYNPFRIKCKCQASVPELFRGAEKNLAPFFEAPGGQVTYDKSMTESAAPLRVDNISKTYRGAFGGKGIQALRGVSLELRPGEVFGLLGPNGAGKTTLVKVALDILSADSGQSWIFGLPVKNARTRLRVGYLPENHRFPPRLTGRGLLQLTGRLHGMSEDQINRRSDELLERVGMTRWAGTRITKYSKGMAQRVGIAQALIHDPDLVILDEPTDGIDPVGRAEVGEIIRELKAAGKTALLNSHALAEIEQICDRVAILHKGKVLKVGSVDELTAVGLQYVLTGSFGVLTSDPPPDVAVALERSAERLVVRVSSEDKLDLLTDWLRSQGASIRSLTQRTHTLEEVFMEMIDQKKESD